MNNKYGISREPLDICYRMCLVRLHQYKAGLHLRWLRSLRFGAVRRNIFSRNANYCEDTYLADMNQRYIQSTKILDDTKSYNAVMDICVYLKFPKFLKYPALASRAHEYRKFCLGLDELAKFYGLPQKVTEVNKGQRIGSIRAVDHFDERSR